MHAEQRSTDHLAKISQKMWTCGKWDQTIWPVQDSSTPLWLVITLNSDAMSLRIILNHPPTYDSHGCKYKIFEYIWTLSNHHAAILRISCDVHRSVASVVAPAERSCARKCHRAGSSWRRTQDTNCAMGFLNFRLLKSVKTKDTPKTSQNIPKPLVSQGFPMKHDQVLNDFFPPPHKKETQVSKGNVLQDSFLKLGVLCALGAHHGYAPRPFLSSAAWVVVMWQAWPGNHWKFCGPICKKFSAKRH